MSPPHHRSLGTASFALLAALFTTTALASENLVGAYIRSNGQAPADYVLSKLSDHRVVILGENHWLRNDVDLVMSLLPALRHRKIALAMEFFPSAHQGKLDTLVLAKKWDPALANEIMHLADWPYVQYREILRAAWAANQSEAPEPPVRVIAMGAPPDWRERHISYDGAMAETVSAALENGLQHILAYCGMHHAFTRYLQVDHRTQGRADRFMTRFGNILWQKFGQDVFLIALHKPEWCGPADDPTSQSCAPFGGAIDCIASTLGRPVAFDVVASPLAEMKFPAISFYAFGYPYLRFVDYTDGYIWLQPLDQLRQVDLIPLAEFSPEDAKSAEQEANWKKRQDKMSHPFDRGGWDHLGAWRSGCNTSPAH
jgi:hypothetical protein